MHGKNLIKKTTQITIAMIAVTFISPFVLAKVGFWGESQAQETATTKAVPNGNIVSYADSIEHAMPAVVSIHSTKELSKEANALARDPVFRYFFGDNARGQMPPDVQSGIGSGVIVSKDGYVLTNNHVINEASQIKIKLNDGREAVAKVVGSDPDTDLAILKVDLKNLQPIKLGNSDGIRVGDIVLAIGNPFGVGQTVTHGIISAMHRTDLGISTFENFIQTDAAINPGNSGGALIDIHGNLIGINNAIYSRSGGFQGIGFAIPINLAKDIMEELIGKGHITRGWLGISVAKLTDEVRKAVNYPKGDGAVIAGVIRNGPAYTAGLRPGDVIISVDNKPTKDPNEVLGLISKLKPDTAYPIAVVRNNETLDFRVVIGKRPYKKGAEQEQSMQPQEEQTQ